MDGKPPRQACVVSFSGIDGAGKSTQIALLRQNAETAGLRVSVISFWDQVARFTRYRETAGHALFHGDKGIGRPEAPIVRRDKNVRSPLMTVSRLVLYFADALSARRVTRAARRGGCDLVICDRYIYDELANLDLGNRLIRIYAGVILRIVPGPDAAFLLDAEPSDAFARKPEYPLAFLYLSRASYLTLTRLATGMLTIAANETGIVEGAVQRHLVPLLPAIQTFRRDTSRP